MRPDASVSMPFPFPVGVPNPLSVSGDGRGDCDIEGVPRRLASWLLGLGGGSGGGGVGEYMLAVETVDESPADSCKWITNSLALKS